MSSPQADLFERPSVLPPGFKYERDLLSSAEEAELVRQFHGLEFKEFEFHGFLGKRRVVSFGWRYDFNGGGLRQTDDMPAFLLPIREKAAHFAGRAATAFQQVLLTEYAPGAAIGWHKDRPVFGEVVGISLLSSCVFRLRRRVGSGFERASLLVEPRSVYLLSGPSRSDWEHSIPAVDQLRYSITFRNFKPATGTPEAAGAQ
jgi:alkylated DNA repair dioxygenase AlkB